MELVIWCRWSFWLWQRRAVWRYVWHFCFLWDCDVVDIFMEFFWENFIAWMMMSECCLMWCEFFTCVIMFCSEIMVSWWACHFMSHICVRFWTRQELDTVLGIPFAYLSMLDRNVNTWIRLRYISINELYGICDSIYFLAFL